jgi:hypothetical protein
LPTILPTRNAAVQVATVADCERLLEALLPPGFDRGLVGPMARSMMAGELSRWACTCLVDSLLLPGSWLLGRAEHDAARI